MDRNVHLRWLFLIGAIWLMLIIGCKSGERQNPSEVRQSPSSNARSTAATKYLMEAKPVSFWRTYKVLILGTTCLIQIQRDIRVRQSSRALNSHAIQSLIFFAIQFHIRLTVRKKELQVPNYSTWARHYLHQRTKQI